MKHYQSTKAFSMVAVVISIALLVFLCIYPAAKTHQTMERIIALSEECLNAIKTESPEIIGKNLSAICDVLETEGQALRLFYSHEDIAQLEGAAHRAEKIYSVVYEDMEVLVSSICEIMESAEHITERDALTWGSFI